MAMTIESIFFSLKQTSFITVQTTTLLSKMKPISSIAWTARNPAVSGIKQQKYYDWVVVAGIVLVFVFVFVVDVVVVVVVSLNMFYFPQKYIYT